MKRDGKRKDQLTSRRIDGPMFGQEVCHLVRRLCYRTSTLRWSAELLLHDLCPIIRILLHEIFLSQV